MSTSSNHLILVLGDQLGRRSALVDASAEGSRFLLVEAIDESRYVWSAKQRTVQFLAAMRHFRDDMQNADHTVCYRELGQCASIVDGLKEALREYGPEKVTWMRPGEYRLYQAIHQLLEENDIDHEMVEDDHFLCTLDEFSGWLRNRKEPRMEYFYREMRKKYGILMENGKPTGGDWNYDQDNRKAFPKSGPESPAIPGATDDPVVAEVINAVEELLEDHPGSLESFDWPVTPEQAVERLRTFIDDHLESFGRFQDAMWVDEPYLHHSRISSALNLKLLDPRDVISAAEAAYRDGNAPLNAVEGFIRQILGWREYVRGIYFARMPGYLESNALEHDRDLPEFFWTGDTEMACLQQTVSQTLRHGYAHHIQRLMVTGLYALLLGVEPKQVHEWYLAVYVDAIEWVEAPNTIGMSQYGDGGYLASKPYVATGKYIKRMSNYCDGCPYNPDQRVGQDACPFTTLYWDFLIRHEERFRNHPRMALQIRNLDRIDADEKEAIRRRAGGLKGAA